MSNNEQNFVKIVSDGDYFNTHVYTKNGEEIEGITDIRIDISGPGDVKVHLTLIPGELDITALVETITHEQVQSVILPVKDRDVG